MSKPKQYQLPNLEAMQDAYNSFTQLASKFTELNNKCLEQSKQYFQQGIDNSQVLYKVSTPEDLMAALKQITAQNLGLASKSLLADLDLVVQIYREACAKSVCNGDGVQCNSARFFEFYSKLLPTPLTLQFDEMVKNALLGNHQAMQSLQDMIQDALTKVEQSLHVATDVAMDNLDKSR